MTYNYIVKLVRLFVLFVAFDIGPEAQNSINGENIESCPSVVKAVKPSKMNNFKFMKVFVKKQIAQLKFVLPDLRNGGENCRLTAQNI